MGKNKLKELIRVNNINDFLAEIDPKELKIALKAECIKMESLPYFINEEVLKKAVRDGKSKIDAIKESLTKERLEYSKVSYNNDYEFGECDSAVSYYSTENEIDINDFLKQIDIEELNKSLNVHVDRESIIYFMDIKVLVKALKEGKSYIESIIEAVYDIKDYLVPIDKKYLKEYLKEALDAEHVSIEGLEKCMNRDVFKKALKEEKTVVEAIKTSLQEQTRDLTTVNNSTPLVGYDNFCEIDGEDREER